MSHAQSLIHSAQAKRRTVWQMLADPRMKLIWQVLFWGLLYAGLSYAGVLS